MSNTLWVHNGSPELDAASQYKMIITVSIVLTTIMMVIVSLRIYVRGVMLKIIGADDWVALAAALCSISYNGLCIGQTKWGLGLTLALRPTANLSEFTVLNFAGKPIYTAGILLFKVSMCLTYLRILAVSSRRYKQVVWAVLVSCIAGHLGGILLLIFLCNPIEKSWKPLVAGSCVPNVTSIDALAAISIFFDVVILILPIPIVVRLPISNRKRLGLVGMFCLGVFTTICSIMRLVQITSILATGDQSGLVFWATIELNVGISLTCLPTLLPLIKYYRNQKKSSHETCTSEDTQGKGSAFLESQTQRNGLANESTPGWTDRNSMDYTSLKEILELKTPAQASGSEGIKGTTQINIKVSKVTGADREKNRMM